MDSEQGAYVVRVLAAVMQRLVETNDAHGDDQPVTKFHSQRIPGISILDYLERALKYASCTPECFVLALIYVDRLIQTSTFVVNSYNVHRVMITSILLGAKFFDDTYYNNAYYARIAGVPTAEINALELEFLFQVNFWLNVTPETYHRYFCELRAHADALFPHKAGAPPANLIRRIEPASPDLRNAVYVPVPVETGLASTPPAPIGGPPPEQLPFRPAVGAAGASPAPSSGASTPRRSALADSLRGAGAGESGPGDATTTAAAAAASVDGGDARGERRRRRGDDGAASSSEGGEGKARGADAQFFRGQPWQHPPAGVASESVQSHAPLAAAAFQNPGGTTTQEAGPFAHAHPCPAGVHAIHPFQPHFPLPTVTPTQPLQAISAGGNPAPAAYAGLPADGARLWPGGGARFDGGDHQSPLAKRRAPAHSVASGIGQPHGFADPAAAAAASHAWAANPAGGFPGAAAAVVWPAQQLGAASQMTVPMEAPADVDADDPGIAVVGLGMSGLLAPSGWQARPAR